MENVYQQKIWALQEQIYTCPCLLEKTNSCYKHLKNRKYGPDAIYVGEYYGLLENHPKILFIGNNPNSDADDFGIKMNTDIFKRLHPRFTPQEFYAKFYTGMQIRDRTIIGISEFDPVRWPRWINTILQCLFPIYHKAFDILKTVAVTNGVLCKGQRSHGTPDARMKRNCLYDRAWLRKTWDFLDPDLLLVFSKSTWNAILNQALGDFHPQWLAPYGYEIKISPNRKRWVFRIPHLTRFAVNSGEFQDLVRQYRRLRDPNILISQFVLEKILAHVRKVLVINHRDAVRIF